MKVRRCSRFTGLFVSQFVYGFEGNENLPVPRRGFLEELSTEIVADHFNVYHARWIFFPVLFAHGACEFVQLRINPDIPLLGVYENKDYNPQDSQQI